MKNMMENMITNLESLNSIMELHNLDKTMIEEGACVQMNPQGNLNIADCGDTAHLVCEYENMNCETLDSYKEEDDMIVVT